MQEITTASPNEHTLVILDSPSNTSLKLLCSLLTSSKTDVIILSHNVPEVVKQDVKSVLKRNVALCEVDPLSELQVTQRLVYSVQSSFHLPPYEEDQKTFQELSLLCTGSPVLVKIIQSSLYCSITDSITNNNTACAGLRNCWKVIEESLALLTEIEEDDDPDVAERIQAIISTVNLTTSSEHLLHCLSCLGGLPVPHKCLNRIASAIDPQQPQLRIRELLQSNLLHGYPSPIITDLPQGTETSCFFVPRVVADALWVDSDPTNQYLSLLVLKQVLMEQEHPSMRTLLCQTVATFEAVLLETEESVNTAIIPGLIDHYMELLHHCQSIGLGKPCLPQWPSAERSLSDDHSHQTSLPHLVHVFATMKDSPPNTTNISPDLVSGSILIDW